MGFFLADMSEVSFLHIFLERLPEEDCACSYLFPSVIFAWDLPKTNHGKKKKAIEEYTPEVKTLQPIAIPKS